MADNVTANPGVGGAVFATDDVGGVQFPRSKVVFGDDGVATDVSAATPLPIVWSSGTVAISGTVAVTQSGAWSVSVSNFPATQPVSIAATVAVSGPLTDTQLRAAAVPVSVATVPLATGAATAGNQTTEIASLANLDVLLSTRTKPADQQHAIVDSGTLTAVTAITNALPAGTNVIGHVITDAGSTTAVTGTVAVSAAALPLPAGAALEAGNLATLVARQPALGSAVAAASSPVVIASDQVLPISATSLPLPTAAATEATLLAIRDAALAQARTQAQFLAFQSMMSGGFLPIEV